MAWAEVIKAAFQTIGNSIDRANVLYTSRVNTANSNRSTGAFVRNLPLVIVCLTVIILLFLPNKTK